MTDWNPEYFAGRLQGWTTLRFAQTVYHLVPWYLIHLFALPIAIAILILNVGLRKNLCGGNRQSPPEGSPLHLAEPLMAGLYLGWVFQSFAFQHLFDYVQFPGILLGFTVVAVPIASLWQRRPVRLSLLTMGLLVCMFSLPRQYTNTGLWQTCLRNGTSPEVRAELALILNPDWRKLAEVADFLRTQNLSDGELTCYTSDLVWVYDTLELRPSTRFAYLWEILVYLPDRRPEIYEAVANSPQKLFVYDESGEKLPRQISRLLGDEAFRAGPYIVYRVVPPQG